MSKRKCRYCGERKDRDEMLILNLNAFCDHQCAYKYAVTNSGKARLKEEKRKEKEARAELRERKERLKTNADWAKELQTLVNRAVRLRDINQGCISCDKPSSWHGQWHASHFYSVGHSSNLRFNMWNIHKGCSVCNNWLSGNIDNYRPALEGKIGAEKLEWLDRNAANLCKRDADWYKRAIRIAKKAVKRYERRAEKCVAA